VAAELRGAGAGRLCCQPGGAAGGYRTVKVRQGRWREIERLELCEVSLVARPMQPHARVHACCAVETGEAGSVDARSLSPQVRLSDDGAP